MPELFDDFDLNLEFINTGIAPCGDSTSDSVAVCSGGSGNSGTGTSMAPTCINVCGYTTESQ